MRSKRTLADICSHIVDCPHRTAPESPEAYAFAVGTKAIAEGRINYAKAKPVSKLTYEEWIARLQPKPKDVILAREAPVGPVAPVPDEPLICLGQRTVLLRGKPDAIDRRYLLYLLSAPTTQGRLRTLSEGSTVPHLNVSDIRKFPVLLPSLVDQKQVAWVLGTLDDKIDNNRQLAQTLEEIAAAIFRARFITFTGRDNLVEGENGLMPNGWHVGRIGDHTQTVLGGTPSRKQQQYWADGTIPWINSGKINEFRILEPTALITVEALNNSAAKLMPAGTTVIAITGATLGQVSRLEIEASANQSVVGVLGNERLPDEYLYFWIRERVTDLLSRQTGAAQQHINKGDVNDLLVLLPPTEVMAEFCDEVRPLLRRVATALFENQRLVQIRDCLLPRLITGGHKAAS